jgi:hypothetical protein
MGLHERERANYGGQLALGGIKIDSVAFPNRNRARATLGEVGGRRKLPAPLPSTVAEALRRKRGGVCWCGPLIRATTLPNGPRPHGDEVPGAVVRSEEP